MPNSMLTVCPAYKTEVSARAASCPTCGHPLQTPTLWSKINKSPAAMIGIVVILLLLIFGPKAIVNYIVLHFFAPSQPK